MSEMSEDEHEAMRLVLVHEYRRCDQAFIEFSDASLDLYQNKWSKKNALAVYDSYARFLHHLYEFYNGCFKRNFNSLKKISHDKLDKLFLEEAEKMMMHRRNRIKRGDANPSENHISYYQEPVPVNFGTDFRQTRNRLAHTDLGRSGFNHVLTLPQFYEKNHKFIMLFYDEAHWLWHAKANEHDWGEIEDFGKAVRDSSHIEKQPLIAKIMNFLFYRKLKKIIESRRNEDS